MYASIMNLNSLVDFKFVDLCRGYLVQLRQELGQRLIEKVFDPQTGKPSKVSIGLFL